VPIHYRYRTPTVAIGKSTVEAHVGIGPNDNGPGFIIAAGLHVTLPGADAETAKDVWCVGPVRRSDARNWTYPLSH
jgi:organic hydroperoxide reductase OsmC/OhrA